MLRKRTKSAAEEVVAAKSVNLVPTSLTLVISSICTVLMLTNSTNDSWLPPLALSARAWLWRADADLNALMPNTYLDIAIICLLLMSLTYFSGIRVFGWGTSQTWYFTHAVVNAFIVYAAWDDVWYVLKNPLNAHAGFPRGRTADSMTPIMILHIFHIYAMPCTTEDYIHHAVSVGLVGGIGCTVPWGYILNLMNFFICGLPGGIDYVLLFLVKAGLLKKLTEKRVNSQLNLMIRWPGIAISSYIAVMAKFNAGSAPIPGWLPIFSVVLLHSLNASYYCQKVIGNYYVSHHMAKINEKEKTR